MLWGVHDIRGGGGGGGDQTTIQNNYLVIFPVALEPSHQTQN